MAEKQNTPAKTEKTRPMVYRNLYTLVDAGFVYPFIPGTIVDICVKVGQTVKEGDCLLQLYAMKMNNEICAPITGTIKKINVKAKQIVSKNDVLIEIE